MSGRRRLMLAGGGAPMPIAGLRGTWWYVSSGGATVSSAMTISGGTIGLGERGAYMEVWSRGTASAVAIANGGLMRVFEGGTAQQTALFSSGMLSIREGGSASGTTISAANASYLISSGGVTTDDLLKGAGAVTNLYRGGLMERPILSAGTLRVSGGTILGPTVRNGDLYISSGGKLLGGEQSGGYVHISSGGLFSGFSGGPRIYSGGSGCALTVPKGQTARVISSGILSGATVSSGGFLHASGGTIHQAEIASAGSMFLYKGAANDTIVSRGGRLYISGGVASGITAGGAGAGWTYLYVSSGGLACDVTVSTGCRLYVFSGGTATDVTSMTGATIVVSAGGTITYKQQG